MKYLENLCTAPNSWTISESIQHWYGMLMRKPMTLSASIHMNWHRWSTSSSEQRGNEVRAQTHNCGIFIMLIAYKKHRDTHTHGFIQNFWRNCIQTRNLTDTYSGWFWCCGGKNEINTFDIKKANWFPATIQRSFVVLLLLFFCSSPKRPTYKLKQEDEEEKNVKYIVCLTRYRANVQVQ